MSTYILFGYLLHLLSCCLVHNLIERLRMPYPATPRDDLFTAFLEFYFHFNYSFIDSSLIFFVVF